MRKVITLVILLGFICSAVSASATEYDLGGGQTLLLHEDGTYEIVTSKVEVDRIVGRQYKLDLMRSVDPFITLAMMEEPSLAFLGKDYYYSILEDTGIMDMIIAEIPDFSMVFLSDEKVLISMEGEIPLEMDYRITPSKTLYIVNIDGIEQEFGNFSEEYDEICINVEDSIPVYLVSLD